MKVTAYLIPSFVLSLRKRTLKLRKKDGPLLSILPDTFKNDMMSKGCSHCLHDGKWLLDDTLNIAIKKIEASFPYTAGYLSYLSVPLNSAKPM
eukprot:8856852-Ditylum_brightwellii.AAC.1